MLSMMMLVSLVIVIISYSVVKDQKQAAEQQAYNDLESLSQLIATNSLSAVVFNDSVAAQQTLLGLKNRPDLLSAIIFDDAGQIFTSYHRDKQISIPKPARINSLLKANQAYTGFNEQGLGSYIPMLSEGETVGLVYLINDLSSLQQHLNHFYEVVIITALIAFMASFILALLLQAIFTGPLDQLLTVIQNITQTKHYGQRAPMSNTIEFNELALSFNTMLTEVEQRGQQLQTINLELEQRIGERTEELESALALANEGNRAQTEFIAMMSHEVRTPLNGIIGVSELLKTYRFDENVENIINMLNDSSQDLLSLLDETLDFSKLEANKVEVEMRKFCINHFLRSLFEANRPLLDKKKLEFKLEFTPEADGYYLGDALRLRQVLNNLISNAVKFTPQGQITLKMDSELIGSEVMCCFHVIDSGIGIDTVKLDDLFSPFTQADSSITREYGGTGLGLAICKQLVELMQGTFGVDSKVDKGSHFWFKIPLIKVNLSSEVLAETPIIKGDRDQSPASILIAEDTPVNQFVIKSLLDTFGHHCDVVNNGQEAVDKAKTKRYDIIFMDYHMPEMDGITATKIIREQAEMGSNTTTPIIALTADIQPQVSKNFRRAGANDTLIKPFTRAKLTQKLTQWLPKMETVDIEPSNVELNNVETNNDRPTNVETTNVEPSNDRLNNDGQAILDKTVLSDIFSMSTDGNKDLVQQVVKLYFESCPELIKKMHQAFEDKDKESLFKAAHSLKSSSANLGAMCLADVAKQIESLSRDGQLDKTHALLVVIDGYYKATQFALDEQIMEYN